MDKIPKFTIIYNDGTTITGGGDDDEVVAVYLSRKWLEAPADGVSHINVEEPQIGRSTLKEYDYYFMLPVNFHGKGTIGGSNKIGAYLRQSLDLGMSLIKFGGWTTLDNYRALANKAIKDTWVPRESAKVAMASEDSADD